MKSMLRVEHAGVAGAAIAARSLNKRRRGRQILEALELTVIPGAVYLLVGPNGSGKTTTLRILQGLIRPDSGACEVAGLDPAHDGPLVRASVGYVAERHDWGYGWLRIADMFGAAADYYPAWDSAYATRLAERLDVDDTRRYIECSKGEARRAQMILALAHRPPVLLLDEPTDGLDPVGRKAFFSVLAEHIAESECSVLASTHLVSEFEGVADHIGVMRDGQLALEASVEQLRARLRRYRAQVPAMWQGAPGIDGSVVQRVTADREISWTIWGVPAEIRAALAENGAKVVTEEMVSIEDAAVAFLARDSASAA